MSATTAEEAGRRVEEVLDRLAENGDAEACAAAEEVVRVLMEFYGSGIARVVDLLGRPAARPPADPLGPLLADELVASLLNLHGLHPEDVPTRIDRALAALSQPVENAGFDTETGVLRLRVTGSSGCGCGGTQESVRQAAVDALACYAPEVTGVELETGAAREPALLQISTRPSLAGADGRSSAAL
ncbi:hypothetical protein M5362_12435 [Streptomyces sp. Je 1-79]|uniref:hypothetical protein n=1 Tax=Streptomyces sp. Je 1-79 TaxID=2943847 RepID=UPI0021A84F65|nr:hypothetical protein [Streptomyces sp. Je 1-79]MCT4353936.1 hypothetical protein [Streptomyces sp. Je 1-79]